MSSAVHNRVERRRHVREFMKNSALRIDACDGRPPITCFIWDISESGARLTLCQNVKLPSDIAILKGNLTYRARVVWQKEDQIGVEFLEIEEPAGTDGLGLA
jgi:PilZ domain-containing protein